MKIEGIYFDETSYGVELRSAKRICGIINTVLQQFESIKFWELTHALIKAIYEGNLEEIDRLYLLYKNNQTKGIKNDLLKKYALSWLEESYKKFRGKMSMAFIDISKIQCDLIIELIDIKENKLTISEEYDKFLKRKYTVLPDTENQKKFIELVNKFLEIQDEMASMIGDRPLIDGCFYVDEDGKLKYLDGSINEVK